MLSVYNVMKWYKKHNEKYRRRVYKDKTQKELYELYKGLKDFIDAEEARRLDKATLAVRIEFQLQKIAEIYKKIGIDYWQKLQYLL